MTDFNTKFATVISFLLFLWLLTNFVINKIRSGQWKIPAFLENFLHIKNAFNVADKPYRFSILQREILNDGNEILIASVGRRVVLLSKNLHHGIRYLTELETTPELQAPQRSRFESEENKININND